ncbi:hypothetical protein CISG_01481 [Coccidioides immitis RMSCC 3703]|uniref:Uncharacterized protein n=1 Tax=Coccidioides immitis RMSCC 3703 TaxID=454286 RepID=A0A0J8R085_COCIT|nr:hypothetical protein CISG_01481 [Coccidioides immitis RMSCC 3703]
MREDVVERIRHFEILRDGFVLAYGAVSEKETIDDMKAIEARRLNEEVLRPQHRPGGYISVTAKSDSGLKVEFAIVHRDEGDSPEIKPALVNSEKSTVELDYNEPLAGPEAVFRAFLHECIIFLPIAEIQRGLRIQKHMSSNLDYELRHIHWRNVFGIEAPYSS